MSDLKEPKVEIHKFANESGEFQRKPSNFRNWISSEPGALYPPQLGRYHLYVSYLCPWATRLLIVRRLKGLLSIIGLSVVHWHMDNKGWRFPSKDDPCDGATEEPLYGYQRLSQLYYKADLNYLGRFTVPVLWDKQTHTIVNNESSEIIRMFNTEFNSLVLETFQKIDFYPKELQLQIDHINDLVYDNINNGVYKTGFSTKQEVYEKECVNVFAHLDKIESILKENKAKGERYLVGGRLTEADIRLFVTIIRFDPVYVQHFKCNLGMIRFNYPLINEWCQHLYWQIPGFKEETNFDHIKFHYTKSHPAINPHGITPLGPIPNILPI